MRVSPLGDSAVVMIIGESVADEIVAHVRAVVAAIDRRRPAGVVDVVPVFATVVVYFDPVLAAPFDELRSELEALAARAGGVRESMDVRTVDVPVCYGGRHGPDLEMIASRLHRRPEDVAAMHASGQYVVYAIGFAPGFPYLGGLSPELAAPRRSTPRPRVPSGSVGIGGTQTGIYPLETPGGWNLIGRTPLKVFDPRRAEPSLLQAGDRVTFRPISDEQFDALARVALAPARPANGRDSPGSPASGNEVLNTEGAGPAPGPGIEVVRAGMYTTVQDLGRCGHRARGVPLSGAADPFALRVANLLVGNREDEAGLEFTLVGPELKFLHDTVIAISGAEFGDGPRWRPVAIRGGTTLTMGAARSGCRGYLAVAGGIAVAPVLGSRSTYRRARLGGHQGRRLRDGDVLPVPPVQRRFREHWWVDPRILPRYGGSAVVRVVDGAQAGQFDPGWTERVYRVSAQSDRMGVRLSGPALRHRVAGDLVSSAVAPGTMQVPPDGQPIVLLADAQTIGGYPQAAHVISVDLPVVAQLRPGDAVRFVIVTLTEARERAAAQERALGLLREGVAQKLA